MKDGLIGRNSKDIFSGSAGAAQGQITGTVMQGADKLYVDLGADTFVFNSGQVQYGAAIDFSTGESDLQRFFRCGSGATFRSNVADPII